MRLPCAFSQKPLEGYNPQSTVFTSYPSITVKSQTKLMLHISIAFVALLTTSDTELLFLDLFRNATSE